MPEKIEKLVKELDILGFEYPITDNLWMLQFHLCNPDELATLCVSFGILGRNEKARIMQDGTPEPKKVEELFIAVMKRGDWRKVIDALQKTHNHFIIEKLIEYANSKLRPPFDNTKTEGINVTVNVELSDVKNYSTDRITLCKESVPTTKSDIKLGGINGSVCMEFKPTIYSDTEFADTNGSACMELNQLTGSDTELDDKNSDCSRGSYKTRYSNSVSQNKLAARYLKTKQKKRILLGIVLMTTIILVALFVSLLYIVSNQVYGPQDRQDTSSDLNKVKPFVWKVNSSDDLAGIDAADTVIIFSLVDEFNSTINTTYLSFPKNVVNNLIIAGPISLDWLTSIVRAFNSLKHLSIDLNQVCTSINIEAPLTYQPLILERCEYFTVLNSRTCYLEGWIYRWNFPDLKYLTLNAIDVNRRNCNLINNLIHANEDVKRNYIDVHILDCNLVS